MSENPVQIDHSHGRAILKEVGERLRDYLGKVQTANPSLEKQLAMFDALDDTQEPIAGIERRSIFRF